MTIASSLLAWYRKQGRAHLPWRQSIHPYRVWLSEIMLQQTQVNTVIPYFNRFIEAYPTVLDLAQAELDDVLHLWSGLGYYARARNLYKTAQIIAENHQGHFPNTFEQLLDLPGIGRSTAGAILAIAFQQKYPILDGNVRRILARIFEIPGWPGQPSVQQQLWQCSESILPDQHIDDFTQAIMDLGATVCLPKKPNCSVCPIQKRCNAYQHDSVDLFPHKKPKKAIPCKTIHLLVVQNQNQEILLEKRAETGIWGGLWSLPEMPLDEKADVYLYHRYGLSSEFQSNLGEFEHVFSHYRLIVKPILVTLKKPASLSIAENTQKTWINLAQPPALGLPAPVKKFLEKLAPLNLFELN